MPLRKSHGSLPKLAVIAAAAAFGTFGAESASASSLSMNETCAAQSVTSPLAAFGDTASYYLAPDGGFESGANGWKLSNAKVISGNETLGVIPGTKALQMGAGLLTTATATTPEFCIDASNPAFRFVVKNSSSVGVITTTINFKSRTGATLSVPAKTNLYALGKWSLAASQPLATAIPALYLGSGTTATITFRSAVATIGQGISIDNVLVDPYRRG
jgi:hypothetical protein